ncbi:MAG: 4-hydroxy-tetrahydrodipicolinate reductase [Candidatus Binatia bacterium]|nr:MAG: 4-hydroxy-tetrahydrodipicolinate reductase [Candidatus Binatia bacterium]
MSRPPLVVSGAAGRMGRQLLSLAFGEGYPVLGAVEAPGHPLLGTDAGELVGAGRRGVPIGDDYTALPVEKGVTLEFTNPQVTLEHLRVAAARQAPIVVGTTGFDDLERQELEALASRTRSVVAPNMSVGVNVLLGLVELAARSLGHDFDIEVLELHHRMKEDAPSGTALALGRVAASARGRALEEIGVYGRQGRVGRRKDSEIGVLALRGGDAVGDHTVYFLGPGERLELTHRAQSRECLARGALRAASWLWEQRRAGLFTMRDVLGLGSGLSK